MPCPQFTARPVPSSILSLHALPFQRRNARPCAPYILRVTATIPTSLTNALAARYELRGILGTGGMATVYMAYDRKHDRDVAVKVLRPEIAASLGAERF